MKRVLVLGCPGSGKSTFARKLRDITGLPLYYLDQLYHNADKTCVSDELFLKRQNEIVVQNEWIIDGNYLGSLECRLGYCDTVFLMDVPLEVSLQGVASRIGTKREDMPWVEDEFDEEFKQYILDFPKDQLPKVKQLLSLLDDVQVFVFGSREDADNYLSGLKNN